MENFRVFRSQSKLQFQVPGKSLCMGAPLKISTVVPTKQKTLARAVLLVPLQNSIALSLFRDLKVGTFGAFTSSADWLISSKRRDPFLLVVWSLNAK